MIESTIAIFLLIVGTVGAFTLIQKTITFTAISSSQLVASYLAQEGIEVIRNIFIFAIKFIFMVIALFFIFKDYIYLLMFFKSIF